jgi:hypothetical protein
MKAIKNIGIINDSNAFILSSGFPFLISIPREAWALRIRCDSSNNEGTKRMDNEIIIDHSLTGALTNFNGDKMFEIAFVNSTFVVVETRIVVEATTKKIFKVIFNE